MGRHVACRDWWREANLRNVRGRARLGPLQPMSGAVELLTAAALELPLVLPNCRREAQRQSGPGCVAFVADPDVLFLDEPTSGLDSKMAEEVVKVLQRLAREPRTIICSIHQPSFRVFNLFDHLVLLARGHVVYNADGADTSRCAPAAG